MMTLYSILLLVFNVLEPIILAILAQRRGHVGFIWFIAVAVAAGLYTWFVDGLVSGDPAFRTDPNFYEQTGQYREIGGLAIGSVILPAIVALILLTWPKAKADGNSKP